MDKRKCASILRLLFEAQTVQNFSLYDVDDSVDGGAGDAAECIGISAGPSKLVTGAGSAGGGGGGGTGCDWAAVRAARRASRGSVAMFVLQRKLDASRWKSGYSSGQNESQYQVCDPGNTRTE